MMTLMVGDIVAGSKSDFKVTLMAHGVPTKLVSAVDSFATLFICSCHALPPHRSPTNKNKTLGGTIALSPNLHYPNA